MEIGSIVECINDSGIVTKSNIITPKKGRLYTVIGFCNKPRGMGIYIDECSEIINVKYGNNIKREIAPFMQNRFIEILPPIKLEIEQEAYYTL